MNLMTHDQYDYSFDPNACSSCGGACCTGESGYIWTKYSEIENIARFLDLSVEDFARKYLRKVKHRYSLTEKLIEENNYACIFFSPERKQCTIYPVRPLQCRTFPFWEQFKSNEQEVRDECPGII